MFSPARCVLWVSQECFLCVPLLVRFWVLRLEPKNVADLMSPTVSNASLLVILSSYKLALVLPCVGMCL